MPTELRLLAYSAILTWLMILVASMLKAGGDIRIMFGNREALPEVSPMANRADRAAKNMLENMVLFVAVLIASSGAHDHDRIVLGARMFFWARLAYWPVYVFGISYLRTALWTTAVAGMGLMLATAL